MLRIRRGPVVRVDVPPRSPPLGGSEGGEHLLAAIRPGNPEPESALVTETKLFMGFLSECRPLLRAGASSNYKRAV